MKKRGGRAVSLVEAVLAAFLLTVAFLVLVRLFHAGLQYFNWVERKTAATAVAEKRIAQLRHWSRTQSGSFTGFPTGPDPSEPTFLITTTLSNLTLASPNRELDSNFTQRREMTNSTRQARVTVAWNRGQVQLYTLLIAPYKGWRNANPIVIGGSIPATVTAATPISLTATGYDAGGNVIQDLFFRWYVNSDIPNGTQSTVNATRDGRSAVFHNSIQLANGNYQPNASGDCRVTVRAVYQGVEKMATTPVIHLAP